MVFPLLPELQAESAASIRTAAASSEMMRTDLLFIIVADLSVAVSADVLIQVIIP